MPNRTDATSVKLIMSSTTDDDVVTCFISVASKLIDQAITNGCGITDADHLEKAERFLTAHLLSTSGAGEDGGGKVKTMEKFESYSVNYAMSSVTHDGIRSTTYGATANMLMKGCLSNMNNARAAVDFL